MNIQPFVEIWLHALNQNLIFLFLTVSHDCRKFAL